MKEANSFFFFFLNIDEKKTHECPCCFENVAMNVDFRCFFCLFICFFGTKFYEYIIYHVFII